MQTQDFNPDTRPLPPGWTQHFESTKQLWYYVQTTVMPPKVSFTHPIDLVAATRSAPPYVSMNNPQMPQPQLAVSPLRTPRNQPQSGRGLTFAQQLYASSLGNSLGPMTSSHSVPHLPTSQQRNRNLPTPPPSTSPPPGTGTHFPHAPFNQTSSSHPFKSTPSSAPPFQNPHRTNTFQTSILPSNNGQPQRHKSSTYSQGMSQHSDPLMSVSRPTRHLITMARPPDQQSLSGLSLEPPATDHLAQTLPSPPPTSILFSQTMGTASASPLTPPLTAARSTPSNISAVAYKPQSNVSPLGIIGGVAIQSARVLAHSLGVRSLSDGVVGALQSLLLTPVTGVDQISLQAVIQMRPDADYQRIINALIKLDQQQHQQFSLMKLQMQQPPPPTTDYQALITEIQRLQALAQAPQVTAAQQQQAPQVQQQQQPQTAAQQYQALVQQLYQQQATIQQQQQQSAQHQALFQQQQQAAAQVQQNQGLLNAHPRPPQPQQSQQHQSTAQSVVQTFLELDKGFQQFDKGFQQFDKDFQQFDKDLQQFDKDYQQFDTDLSPLYSAGGSDSGNGGMGLFGTLSQPFGNPGAGQDFDGFSGFNQDNSGGFDTTYVDMSGNNLNN